MMDEILFFIAPPYLISLPNRLPRPPPLPVMMKFSFPLFIKS